MIVDGSSGSRNDDRPRPPLRPGAGGRRGRSARSADLRLEEPRGNPLFNGHDLNGWFVNNNKGTWAVDDGDIIPTSHQGLHYLRTDKEYANFTLVARLQDLARAATPGWPFARPRTAGPRATAWSCKSSTQPGEVKDSTMAIYGNLPPLDRADKSGEWNRVVVKADGRMISVWVNGELVQHVNTARLSELKHRHLQRLDRRARPWRQGPLPQHLRARSARRPGPRRLVASRATNRAAIVLDRLMNSERLSRADSIGSGVVSKSVPKGGEHVLAELTGPGALVRAWQSYAAGPDGVLFRRRRRSRGSSAPPNTWSTTCRASRTRSSRR